MNLKLGKDKDVKNSGLSKKEAISKRIEELKKTQQIKITNSKRNKTKSENSFKVEFLKLVDSKEYDDAYSLFESEVSKDDFDTEQSNPAYKLAVFFIRNNEVEKAEKLVKYAINHKPKNQDYLALLEEVENFGKTQIVEEIETPEWEKKIESLYIQDELDVDEDYISKLIGLIGKSNLYIRWIEKTTQPEQTFKAISKIFWEEKHIEDALDFANISLSMQDDLYKAAAAIDEDLYKACVEIKFMALDNLNRTQEIIDLLPAIKQKVSTQIYDSLTKKFTHVLIAHHVELHQQAQETRDEISVDRNDFFAKKKAKDLEIYMPVTSKLVKDETTQIDRERISIELMYLDFDIREFIMPYLVKFEANTKEVHEVYFSRKKFENAKSGISEAAFNFSNIMNSSKYQVTFNLMNLGKTNKLANLSTNEIKTLFYLYFESFRTLRNFVIHGNKNIFEKVQWDREAFIHVYKSDDKYIETTQKLEHKFDEGQLLNLYRLISYKKTNPFSIAQDVTSSRIAKINADVFPLAITALFLSNSKEIIIKMAAEIQNRIFRFYVSNRMHMNDGAKAAIYALLGLDENWLSSLASFTL